MSEMEIDDLMAAFAPDSETNALLFHGGSDWSSSYGKKPLLLDIETEPLAPEILAKIVPPYEHKERKKPEPFDPSTVKYGNTKDPKKRRDKLALAEERHAQKVREWERAGEQGEVEYWEDVYEGATLRASRSRVCTAQLGSRFRSEPVEILHGTDEKWIIDSVFEAMNDAYQHAQLIIGFSVFDFDLPYLFRRAWTLGVTIPDWLGSNRLFQTPILDIAFLWRCGQPNSNARISLHELAMSFGVGSKADLDCDGKQFHEFWNDESLRPQAIEYAANDITLLREVAGHMNLGGFIIGE